MRGAAWLVWHSLKRSRTLVLVTGFLLAAFQLVLIFAAGEIQGTNGFGQLAALMPPLLRELLGPAIASFLSFSGIVSLGYFHLTVIGALTAVAVTLGTIPAGEVESGFSDFILSRPVARHWIITRAIVVTVFCCALVLALMVAGTWSGLHTFGRRDVAWPSAAMIGSMAANLYMLALCWGGVGLAISAPPQRGGRNYRAAGPGNLPAGLHRAAVAAGGKVSLDFAVPLLQSL
jgi:ABC-type transport system involved in multi-copper enzyme maturation permease subunit